MHNIKMTSSDGIVLNTSGKYCRDNIEVLPMFDFAINAKRWLVKIQGTQPNIKTVMVENDMWIAEHFSDERMCMVWRKMEGDFSEKSCIGGVATNDKNSIVGENGVRVTVSGDQYESTNTRYPLNTNSESAPAGYLEINSSGSILARNGSGVRFKDGSYEIVAFLI